MGKIVITDEAGAPATPADGVALYSVGSELRYVDESGAVQRIATDAKANIGTGAVTNSMLATDAKIGSLAALTTDAKNSAQAAINEVDAHADAANAAAAAAAAAANTNIGTLSGLTTAAKTNTVAAINEVNAVAVAGRGGGDGNLMWDAYNHHVLNKSSWGGKPYWEDSTGVAIVDDGSNPYGGRTIRCTVSAKGKGLYLADVGLAPGDVISAGMMCKATTGTWACRLIFRTTGPGASAISTPTGTSRTFAGETALLTCENITIPATANWVTVIPYSASPTSIDIYAMEVHRGTAAAAVPAPSSATATYLRLKEWGNYNRYLMIRNVDANNFHIYQPLPDGQMWIRWAFTKLATGNWTYYGADLCNDDAGTGAYNVIIFDIGYAINFTPNGASNQTCGNHHLNDNYTSVNFYDAAGNVVDPTTAGAAFTVDKLRIEQKGTLRHPDTGTTDHATISRLTEFTLDGPYEHMRLSWLTSGNVVGYWNTGQLLATAADRAWVHNTTDAAFLAATPTLTATGKTKAYTWYTPRKFAFQVECPTAEAIQLRTATLKIYPRTIDADVTRNAGDVDHGEWFWRVIFDKQFEKRI